jgi:hypothetical protein
VKASAKQIRLRERTVCVSDIHGHLDIFQELLKEVEYTADDSLILLGDLYTKGPRPLDTLRYIMELSRSPGVHVLRGNCDGVSGNLTPDEAAWLEALPHVLYTDEYAFVHGGLTSEDFDSLDAWACMKFDAFMEQGLSFSRWVVTGHWPVDNYCYGIASHNPIIDHKLRIAAIDGGMAIRRSAQLNALIIRDGEFSYKAVDGFPPFTAVKAQEESGGTLNITWTDRPVELTRHGEEFSAVRHISTGIELDIPTEYLFTDWEGRLCGSSGGFNYFLPVSVGETVSLVDDFSDRVFAKKDGVIGWIKK